MSVRITVPIYRQQQTGKIHIFKVEVEGFYQCFCCSFRRHEPPEETEISLHSGEVCSLCLDRAVESVETRGVTDECSLSREAQKTLKETTPTI